MEEEFKKESDAPIKVLEVVVVATVLVVGGLYYFYYQQSPISNTPVDVNFKVVESLESFKNSNFDQAIKSADEVLSQDPNNVSALLAKSATLAQKGSLGFQEEEYGTRAIQTAEQVLKVDADNAEAWRIIGYSHESMQEYTEAFDAYNKAIELNPKNALAYSSRGHAYYLTGDHAKAKADYLKALSIDSSLTHALVNLSRILMSEEKYAEATTNLNKALGLEDNLRFKAEIEQLIGVINVTQGKFTEAKVHFQNSLNHDATLAASWVGLANAKFLTLPKDLSGDQASIDAFSASVASIFSDLEKATKINPNQTSAYIITARLLATLGSTEAALGILNDALGVVDKDITLGAKEKVLVRQAIQDDIVFISN